MSIDKELALICKDLRMLGNDKLTKKVLMAYAAATGIENPHVDLSYSYIMRKLRKGNSEKRIQFQQSFKKAFDEALLEDIDEPAEVALIVAMKDIDYKEGYA